MKKKVANGDVRSIRFFNSFEEENAEEYRRYARMSPRERLNEVAHLQKHVWGNWTEKPMKRVISFERVTW